MPLIISSIIYILYFIGFIFLLILIVHTYRQFFSNKNGINYIKALKLFNEGEIGAETIITFHKIYKKYFVKEEYHSYSQVYLYYINILKGTSDFSYLPINKKIEKLKQSQKLMKLNSSEVEATETLLLHQAIDYDTNKININYNNKIVQETNYDELLRIDKEINFSGYLNNLQEHYEGNKVSESSDDFTYGLINKYYSIKNTCWPIHLCIMNYIIYLELEKIIASSSGRIVNNDELIFLIKLYYKILKFSQSEDAIKLNYFRIPIGRFSDYFKEKLTNIEFLEKINTNNLIESGGRFYLLIAEQKITTIMTSGDNEKETSFRAFIFTDNFGYIRTNVKIFAVKNPKIDMEISKFSAAFNILDIKLSINHYNSLMKAETPNKDILKNISHNERYWLPVYIKHSIISINCNNTYLKTNKDKDNSISDIGNNYITIDSLEYSDKLPNIDK